jgi:glycerol kinase
LKVDGGAVVNNLLMQFQADLIGIPVIRPETTETTALGAAYLAGLAVGFWKGVGEIEAQWAAERTFSCTISKSVQENLMTGWAKAVSRSRSWSDE